MKIFANIFLFFYFVILALGFNNISFSKDFYAISFNSIEGDKIFLSNYRNNVILVVNTASFCGFTGQFKGIQNIWKKYKSDGLIVIGVPSYDFGQEAKTNSALEKMVQIMSSKEYTSLFPRDFVKQYEFKTIYAVQSMRLKKMHNEMIDYMKTTRSLQKSESLLDKFVYSIIKMLDVFKFFFVKSYFYYRRTSINPFSLIRNIVSYRRGLKIYKNSKCN